MGKPSDERSPMLAVAAAIMAAVSLACGDKDEENTPTGPSYQRDVQPIFRTYCIDCHHAGDATGYDFADPFDPEKGIIRRPNTWTEAREKLIVDPGNVANSFLIRKVADAVLDDHIEGAPMPLQIASLDAAQVAAVEKWIADGAKNDAYFTDNVAPIFGTAVTLGSQAGKCTYCHHPGAPSLMSVIDPFDPVQGMVTRISRYGGQVVEPGNPGGSALMGKLTGSSMKFGNQMPLRPPRLTAAQVDLLRDWIAAGAPNN